MGWKYLEPSSLEPQDPDWVGEDIESHRQAMAWAALFALIVFALVLLGLWALGAGGSGCRERPALVFTPAEVEHYRWEVVSQMLPEATVEELERELESREGRD